MNKKDNTVSNQQEQFGEHETSSHVADLQRKLEELDDTTPLRSIDDLILFVDKELGFPSQEMDSFKEFAAIKSIAAKQAELALRRKDSSEITPEDVRACSFAKKSYLEAIRYIGEERIYNDTDHTTYYLHLHQNTSGEDVLSIVTQKTDDSFNHIQQIAERGIRIPDIQASIDDYVEGSPHMRARLYPELSEEYKLLTPEQYYASFGDAVLLSLNEEVSSPTTPEELPKLSGKTYVAVDTDMLRIAKAPAPRERIQTFDEYKESIEEPSKETLTQRMRRFGHAVRVHTGMVEKVSPSKK